MSENDKVFVDYNQLKTCVSIIMILDHYGWLRQLKGTGNTVRSTCPIHNGSNDKQFVVNIRNNTWCCFGDCRKGGSILELVAELDKIDIREAAVRIASWFPFSVPHSSARSSSVSENNRPLYRAYTVVERGEGRDKRKSYCEIGAAWEVSGGLRAVLDGNSFDGIVYLIDLDEDSSNIDTVSTPELEDTPPLYRAFTVIERGEGKKKRERWRLLGAAWENKSGIKVVVGANSLDGIIQLREPKETEDEGDNRDDDRKVARLDTRRRDRS
jgi:hypothetical protein